MTDIEENGELTLDFGKLEQAAAASPGIIPVAVQNADTRELILVAYTNEAAFREALRTRTLVLWSTSRNELWIKGATSGATFELVEAFVNCEQNSLLYTVRAQHGGICHTRNRAGDARNCYYRRIDFDTQTLENLNP